MADSKLKAPYMFTGDALFFHGATAVVQVYADRVRIDQLGELKRLLLLDKSVSGKRRWRL